MISFRPALTFIAALYAATPAAAQQLPRLLPVPAEMAPVPGRFALTAATALVVPARDAGARAAADRLAELLKLSRGLTLRTAVASPHPAIRFLRARTGKAESYVLAIDGKGATITAGDDAGLLYGAVTLWQALTQQGGKGAVTIPGLSIHDAPRFAWRGLMLDSARHFQSPAYVRQLIDWMAVNKLNTLHWHLVDDQGWRIEIPKYPRLTSISAWRIPASAPGAPQLPRTGGFYTQAEIRAIVAYAGKRGITIVPEIEMPGHALAAIRAYPELGMGVPIPPGTESDWGVFPWLYNTDDTTFAFLEDVLTEVMALFPSRYIHVGGDEAVKDQWKGSPAIQARMKALGIKDETALQAWFVHRIAGFLEAHHRKLIGWDEILEGDVPADATITSWRGIEGAITAAKAGHDAVLSPSPTLYINQRQGTGPNEPPGRGDVVDLRTVYAFDPAPREIPAEQQHHILGLQANLWTEHVRTEARATWHFFPRASAVAEIGWSKPEGRDFADFIDRLVLQMDRMKPLGMNPATTAFAVRPALDYKAGEKTVSVSLANQSGLPIRYTTDGTPVTARAPLYAGPLALPLPTRLRAASFHGSEALGGAIDQPFDARSVRTRGDEDMKTCSNRVVLALEDDYPAAGKRAVFRTDIFAPCWQWEAAPIGGAKAIALTVGQIPFNFQIGKDIESIHFRTPATPAGEFEIRAGSCQGPLIATLPLAPAVTNPGLTRLLAPLPLRPGNESLCISYTAKGVSPMWALESVELVQ
ncbi:family 20 glycosylhydrolase [Sphingomonas sp. KR3-1]|uniref:beta-N-acetylhexosaminidase n=1 Tax=Sphingomonas sp. KR3-1 TaxID=3156611 RepID=UPI0032B3A2A1